MPTVGLQDDPFARNTVAHRQAGQRREQGNVVLRSVWKQYTHAVKSDKDLVNGQDLAFNYIVFMQLEVKGGVRTLCAMTAAPYELLQSQVSTLKLVLANSKRTINLRAQLGIMYLMTTSNDLFEEAMKHFPKAKNTIQPQHHVRLDTVLEHQSHGLTP